VRLLLVTVSVSFAIGAVTSSFAAQTEAPALSPMDVAATCAAAPAPGHAEHTLRVIGAQDVVTRTIYDDRDLLVIDGGSRAGLQLGARFFVRRSSTVGMRGAYGVASGTVTDGWIRIVAVNDTTALARAERVCGGSIFLNDYLDPFTAPVLPANADGSGTAGDPDFMALAQVVSGPDGHRTAASGEFVTIDRGTEQGIEAGARFDFYRDLTHTGTVGRAPSGLPLTLIGEAVVVSATGSRSLARITRSRDAVQVGDYAVLRR
jgi:hypothetical protein